MAKNKMNYIILGIYVALMIFITIFQVIVILAYPAILENDALLVTFSSITNLLLYLPLFLLFVIIFRKYLSSAFIDLKANKPRYLIIIVVGFITMLIASVASTYILEFLGVTETSENQEALNLLLEGTLFDKIALFSFAVLLVPLIEEMVFRKAVLDIFHFEPRVNDGSKLYKVKSVLLATIAILISSFTFGLIHVMSGDFIHIIYYGGLGIILGVIYLVANKNILVPIAVHFLLNFMVTTILLFG
ncbi:MAG: CPBP family intramembrane metalloprotease [Candidatus Izimaplasma sp.]|nr:CPBP family intramembrane metalloprotease [Candidatus Izimaplasma bacterium]